LDETIPSAERGKKWDATILENADVFDEETVSQGFRRLFCLSLESVSMSLLENLHPIH
jgi:hypothetical protein